MGEMSLLKGILVVMLFYSFAVTIISNSLPVESLDYIKPFQTKTTASLSNTVSEVESSIDRQLNIPIIEIGALVFYSGNIVIDLFLNFIFAIPEMLTILTHGLILIVNVPAYLVDTIQTFAFSVFSIFYILSVISLLLGVRSGRVVG
jgi:hypothetical protein